MRALVIPVILGLALGCARPAASAPPAGPAPTGFEAAPPAFLNACRETCARRQMMRAVSASLIDAQCTDTCTAAWALPLVTTGKAAKAHARQIVRVRGRYVLRGEARFIELADGAALECKGGPALDGPSAVNPPARAIVVGVLEDGALTNVTVLASP